ncbi:biosynthetic-type acetolactate synthase large subunit [Desulfofustis glycolicus]|uniref:Acetolactate synthase n=1 Tax=Desulfofustis glycolicus DSM 9705 TaxID=1121409 RepID=A0A1M5VT86_9BACT|nr:biosynthetic-type acetolactate synthase large subunit [Desulfofustis glycolicus]MCB2216714.1 biosynthetic-type acetolactate synthase large subunit [Desulfobulbaceae bacterium]SHH78466.1 acetolactate synthase, large subunit [Desulfofustis glycolicus DSM 9705]
MTQITGAQAVVQCLVEEKVSTIFGYPGGAVIDLYDELIQSSRIKHILVRHEQAAVHAADGYARVTGQVGVALLTSGPGATNGVTGIATAYLDSIPLVILTGQVPTAMIGNDAFQEVDIVGITRPCTKHNYLVKQKEDLIPTLREAFHIARTGRPGPVLVDLPKDIMKALVTCRETTPIKMHNYQPTHEPEMEQITRACRLIMEAHRPVLYVGGGVVLANADRELFELATKLDIPVTTTLMALGAFPGSHQLSMGMLGMHGTYTANMAVAEADLLISVGARFDDRVTGKLDSFAPRARIIHVDIDPTSISKNVKVDVPIISDCKKALTAMNTWFNNEQQISVTDEKDKHQTWFEQIRQWNERHPLAYRDEGDDIIKPQYVVEMLDELTNGEAIIATEVGQHQMWAAQFYRYNTPRRFLTSGGLGTMGYGLPAAIGAKLARPDAVVIDIAGDASIQMNIQELATARQYGCPVKVAILNNQFLGMVRQWQELFYDKRYASTEMDIAPDFVALAEAYGAVGLRATKKSEVVEVIKQALAVDNTVLMDFRIAREEGVYPMVPAGKATTEMLLV